MLRRSAAPPLRRSAGVTAALAGVGLLLGLPAAASADDPPASDGVLSVPFDALGTLYYAPGKLNLNVYPGDDTGLRASKFYYEPPATLELPNPGTLLDADNPGRTDFVIRFREDTEDPAVAAALERKRESLANQMRRKGVELNADPSAIEFETLRRRSLKVYLKESDGTFTELDMRGVGPSDFGPKVRADLPADVADRMRDDPGRFSVVVAPSYPFRNTRRAVVVAERTAEVVRQAVEKVLGEGDVLAVNRDAADRLAQASTEQIYLRFDEGVSPEVIEKAEAALAKLTPIAPAELDRQAVDKVVFTAGDFKAEYAPAKFNNMTGPERVETVREDLLDNSWNDLKEIVTKDTLDESVKEFEKSYGSGRIGGSYAWGFIKASGRGGGYDEDRSERVRNFLKEIHDAEHTEGTFKKVLKEKYLREIDQQLFSEGVTPKDVTLYRVSKTDLSNRLRAVVEEIEDLGEVEVRRPMTLYAEDATSPTDEMLDRLADMDRQIKALAARNDAQDKRFGTQDSRFAAQDKRFGTQDARINHLGYGVTLATKRLSRTEVLRWSEGKTLDGRGKAFPENYLTIGIPGTPPQPPAGTVQAAFAFANLIGTDGKFFRNGVAYIDCDVPRLESNGANRQPLVPARLIVSEKNGVERIKALSNLAGAVITVVYVYK